MNIDKLSGNGGARRSKDGPNRSMWLAWSLISIFAIGGGLLAGCGSSDSASGGAGGGSGGERTLVVAIPGTPQGIDADQQSGPQTWSMNGQTGAAGLLYKRIPYPYESTSDIEGLNQIPGLGYADLDLSTLEPGVLDKCTLKNGGRTAVWNLRKGVKSAAGNELTAKDVIWGVQRSAANKALGEFFNANAGAANPDQWHQTGKYGLRIESDSPMPTICTFPAHYFFSFKFIDSTEVKKHATEDDPWGNDWLATHSASFGPYTVTKWDADKEVVMEVNPNYYGDKPTIDKILWRVVPDVSARVALLKSGEVDVAESLGPNEIASLGGDANVQVAALRNNLQLFIEMGNSKPPFDNKMVRQAMNLAIPREEIVKSVYHGLANPWQGVDSTIYPGTIDIDRYTFDLDKAKDLLEKAGHGDGFPLELTYSAADPAQEQIGVILRDTFAKLGIELSLRKLPPAALADLVQSSKAEFAMWTDVPFHPEPSFSLSLWYKGDSCCNWQNYSNPKVDSELERCGQILAEKKRRECFGPVQELISEDAPLVWVVEPDFMIGVSKRVADWGWDPNQFYPIRLMNLDN